VLVRANWRGVSSNRVRVAIGFTSEKPADDADAVPTPMPDKPPTGNQSPNVASLPSAADRVRFIEQATFGTNSVLETRLRRIGISAWINEQMEEKRDANGAIRYSAFP
jgi:hypothetical protein